MCGRFAQVIKHDQLQKLARELQLQESSQQIEANFNVAPTQTVAVALCQNATCYIGFFRWGLIPSWSRELPKFALINARLESLSQKPSFRGGLERRRCLIPVSGFYEWRQSDKQPFYFYAENKDPLLLAAIYDAWYAADGSYIPSVTIITQDADHLMLPYHHRMPVILSWDFARLWLHQAQQDGAYWQKSIAAHQPPVLSIHPVSKAVNSSRAQGAELILPINLEQTTSLNTNL